MKVIVSLVSFLLLTISCLGGVVKGKIVSSSGEPLAYATVYVEGTTMGTNANNSGLYELSLPDGLYKLQCQYIGFQKAFFNVSVAGDQVVIHDFKLANQNVEMKEVVISSNTEDPAYPIIRQAIKKRSFYQKQISQFQSGIYLKGVIRTRQIPKKHS
ncbi:MAG: carboxypeptidase-like regulatory domain-containing protein [Chitinophagia bacterium]|nr:carboxypeptidase-like regulatory domain-containing protein [Chitinophagia bacterium]